MQNVVFIAFVAKDVLIYGDLAMIRLLYVIQQVLPRVNFGFWPKNPIFAIRPQFWSMTHF